MGLILCPDFTYSSSLEGEPERKSNRFCEAIYDFFFKSMFPIFFLGRSTQGVRKFKDTILSLVTSAVTTIQS